MPLPPDLAESVSMPDPTPSPQTLTPSQIETLIRSSIEVRENAYAPYSKFQVGAAAMTPDGKVFAGCNVENASYGLCICAERNAICQAVAAGESRFLAIAIAAVPLAMPCGACRQFIHEFGGETIVICVNPQTPGDYQMRTADSLIPDCFSM